MDNVTIFVLKSSLDNSIKGKEVFLSEARAKRIQDDYAWCYDNYNIYIDSIELPFVGKYVSYIQVYHGFDYGRDSMYDVVNNSNLFPSIEKAKETKLWKNVLNLVAEKPDEFNVYPNKICSRDFGTDDWYYGNVMEGKINAEIKRLRVNKQLN